MYEEGSGYTDSALEKNRRKKPNSYQLRLQGKREKGKNDRVTKNIQAGDRVEASEIWLDLPFDR